MTEADLPSVIAVSNHVHAALPEDPRVFAERLRLYPEGCFVLQASGELLGYVISHPWHVMRPPALSTLLEALPAKPSTFYVHDIALLPAARGAGSAAAIVRQLMSDARARGHRSLNLIAVNDTGPFWERFGFGPVDDERLRDTLRSYGAGARVMALDLT
jgi:ribosomal protein S18 acetylase RimI-like enzyme